MPNEEWGVKRACPECAVRFYDLQNDPMTCPSCGAEMTLESLAEAAKSRGVSKARAATAAAKPKPEPEEAADDLDVVLDDDDDEDANPSVGDDLLDDDDEDASNLGEIADAAGKEEKDDS
ncbi:MAG: TIGR02300 family protein [Rhodobacteraceae bacterium]|nr:TIGR02300 family protein [Paracoccaceae bacterium]